MMEVEYKPKICQVCTVQFTYDKFLKTLCSELIRSGFKVETAFNTENNLEKSSEEDIIHNHINIKRSSKIYNLLISTWEFYKLFKQRKYDIVHFHTPIAALVGRVAAKLAGVSCIVYTAHGFYFHDNMNILKSFPHILIEFILGKITDFLFTQAEEDSITAKKLKFLAKNKIKSIGNGVNTNRFQPANESIKILLRSKYKINTQSIVIGIVGRLVEEKGYKELLLVFSQLIKDFPNIVLVICGERLKSDHSSSVAPDIYDYCNKYPDNIIHLGMVNDIENAYKCMDIFCLPSWREGMPRSIVEAMMTGLPTVATNIRGTRELVRHDETGYLFNLGNKDMMYVYLKKLITDEKLRREFGNNAFKYAKVIYDEKYIIEVQVKILKELYFKQISDKKANEDYGY